MRRRSELRSPLGFAALGAALLASACQSSAPQPLHPRFAEFCEQADPQGTLELELRADGSLLAFEVEVQTMSLPARLLPSAQALQPTGSVISVARRIEPRGECWRVRMNSAGQIHGLLFDEQGALLELERQLLRTELPASVQRTADREIPGQVVVSASALEARGELSYRVRKEWNGAVHQVLLRPDGAVLGRVREARARLHLGQR